MRRRDAMAVIGAALGLSGCWGNDLKWRQKLTVVVSTPTGDVSGSSVTEVTMGVNSLFKDAGPYYYKLRGEAVVVDLGNGKFIFALLSTIRSPSDPTAIAATIPNLILQSRTNNEKIEPKELIARIREFEGPVELRANATRLLDLRPVLATFKNINDPTTIRMVSSPLSTEFGGSYALRSISVEQSNAPISIGKVRSVLTWWEDKQPWFKDMGGGVFVDTRPFDEFNFKKDYFLQGGER